MCKKVAIFLNQTIGEYDRKIRWTIHHEDDLGAAFSGSLDAPECAVGVAIGHYGSDATATVSIDGDESCSEDTLGDFQR